MARILQEQKALLANIIDKGRVDSNISECLTNKNEQNNIHSKLNSSQEMSLVVSK